VVSGAAVYIGATEVSMRDSKGYAAQEFFNDWIGSSDSIGWAFRDLKKHLGACEAYDELWSLEYQLYGDPKYGAMHGGHGFTSTAPLGGEPPASSCNVIVPNYVVTTVNGTDYIGIPGGYMLLAQGRPLVPTYFGIAAPAETPQAAPRTTRDWSIKEYKKEDSTMFNPIAFATPQQREQLVQAQQFTKKIKYVVHTEGNRIEFSLVTDDKEAAQLLPQIQEGIVSSVTQMLYTMFAMSGERV